MKQLLFLILMLNFHQLYGKQIKCTSLETAVVETKSGKIRGACSFINANDKIGEDRSANVYKFLGIPYAEPPINEKRFKEPVKKESWSTTLDTQTLPKSCPQYINVNISSRIEFTNSFGLNKNAETSEDCLYLNVYTSNLNPKEKRPVMVILHGGSDSGTGSSVLSVHEPSIFVAMSGVVVVTLNYRLGIFGNLYFNNGTEFFKGNQGFLDQHLALRWINTNAEKFGGDPNRITLMGYGSGALYASYHLVYKPGWTLFRNVILQSFSPINLARNHLAVKAATARVTAFVDYLNCTSLKCLYEMETTDLVMKSRSFLYANMSRQSKLSTLFLKSTFQPVVDGTVFKESIIKSFREGRFKKCFMIVGFNSNDGASLIPLNYGLMQDSLNGNTQWIDYNQMVDFIRKYYNFYPNWPMKNNDYFFETLINEYTKNVTTHPSYFKALRRLLTDESSFCSILKQLEYLARWSEEQQKIYFYIYEHRITTSKYPNWYGIVQGDELASLFAHSFSDDKDSSNLKSVNPFQQTSSVSFSKLDRLVAKEVITKWTNFLYNDNPNKATAKPFKLRDSIGKVWPEFKMNSDSNSMLYYSFKSTGTFSFKMFANQTTSCVCWNKLIPINVDKQLAATTPTDQFKSTVTDESSSTTTTEATSTSTEAITTTTTATTTTSSSNSNFGANDFDSDLF